MSLSINNPFTLIIIFQSKTQKEYWSFSFNTRVWHLQYTGSGNAQPFTSTSTTFVPLPSSEKGPFLLSIYGKRSSYYYSVHEKKKKKVRNDCPMTASAVTLSSLMLTNSLNTTSHDMLVISSMLLMLHSQWDILLLCCDYWNPLWLTEHKFTTAADLF